MNTLIEVVVVLAAFYLGRWDMSRFHCPCCLGGGDDGGDDFPTAPDDLSTLTEHTR